MQRIHAVLSGENPTEFGPDGDHAKPATHRWSRDVDQFLWQVLQHTKKIPLAIDWACSLIANVCCENSRLDGYCDGHSGMEDGSAFPFDGGRIVDAETGNRPCVIHFSGGKEYHSQWTGRLGALE